MSAAPLASTTNTIGNETSVIMVSEIIFDGDTGAGLYEVSGVFEINGTAEFETIEATSISTVEDLIVTGNIYGDGNAIAFSNVPLVSVSVLELGPNGFVSDITVAENASITGTLTTASATLGNVTGGDVRVIGSANAGTVTVTGNATIGDNVDITGTLEAADMTVSGPASNINNLIGGDFVCTGYALMNYVNFDTTETNIAGNVTVGNLLSADSVAAETVFFSNTLTVTGTAAIGNLVGNILGVSNISVTGDTNIVSLGISSNLTANAFVCNNLVVSESLEVPNGTVDVASDTTGDFVVSGATNIVGNLTVSGLGQTPIASMTVNNIAGTGSPETIASANISGTVTVASEQTLFAGNLGDLLSVSSGYSIVANAAITSTPGTADFEVRTSASAASIESSGSGTAASLTVTGQANIGDTETTSTGNIDASAGAEMGAVTVSVASPLAIAGNLTAGTVSADSGTGNITVSGDFSGQSLTAGNLATLGSGSISSSIVSTGTVSADNFSASGTVHAGTNIVAGTMTISGDSFLPDFSVTGTITAQDVSVSGNFDLTGTTMTVTGTSDFTTMGSNPLVGTGPIDLGVLTVSGDTSSVANSTAASYTMTALDMDVSGTFSGNTVVLTGDLDAPSVSALDATMANFSMNVSSAAANGTIDVGSANIAMTGDASGSGTLTVATYSNVANLEITGAGSDLTGITTLNAASVSAGNASAAQFLIDTLTLSPGNLDISGTGTLGTLDVDGGGTIAGNLVSTSGDVPIGNIVSAEDCTVDELILSGNTVVSGKIEFSDLDCQGNLTIGENASHADTEVAPMFTAYKSASQGSYSTGTNVTHTSMTESINRASEVGTWTSGTSRFDFDVAGPYETYLFTRLSGYNTAYIHTLGFVDSAWSHNSGGYPNTTANGGRTLWWQSSDVRDMTTSQYFQPGFFVGNTGIEFYDSNSLESTRLGISQLKFMKNPVFMRYSKSTDQAVSLSTETTVSFDSCDYDTYGMSASLTSGNQLYISKTAYYDVGYWMHFDAAGTSNMHEGFLKITHPNAVVHETSRESRQTIENHGNAAVSAFEYLYLEKGALVSVIANCSVACNITGSSIYALEKKRGVRDASFVKLRSSGLDSFAASSSITEINLEATESNIGSNVSITGTSDYATIEQDGIYLVHARVMFSPGCFTGTAGDPESCTVYTLVNGTAVASKSGTYEYSSNVYSYLSCKTILPLEETDTVKIGFLCTSSDTNEIGWASNGYHHSSALNVVHMADLP